MPLFVQYREDGSVSGTVSGTRPPLGHPRQVGFKDPPPEPPQPDLTHYFDDVAPPNIHDHRVDIDPDGVPVVSLCPNIAKEKARNAILSQLRDLDERRNRAVAELLAGKQDAQKWLLKHLSDQDDLRAQLAAL